jgi:pyruvate dehydrogenase E1 component beta subunit/2-oxoisovalerate dehydrogenase E1 component beta subunit
VSITYLEAIREAQTYLLRNDERVFIYGQDIAGKFGGAFKATKGLAEQFPGRVLNTPIVKTQLLALQLARPWKECARSLKCSSPISPASHSTKFSTTREHNTGAPEPPHRSRFVAFRGTKGSGPFHSQAWKGIYSHYPGLIVVTRNGRRCLHDVDRRRRD